MLYRIAADMTVVLHFAFVLFAVLGGLLVLKWWHCIWLHVPTFIWAALVMFTGWICPLTPLEIWLRQQGGEASYHSSFIEHYILPVLYPTALTRELQVFLGIMVLIVNLGVYSWLWLRHKK
ncbi:MAG: DUF2784 domain-containing protein [Mariprofundaceae bacterium]